MGACVSYGVVACPEASLKYGSRTEGCTGKFGALSETMQWGSNGLVQNRECQVIVAGKRDVLCESASHTCD